MTSLSEEARSRPASNAGGPAPTAKLDELSARANVETDRIETLNLRFVSERVTAAPLLSSGAAMAAARFL